VKVAIVGAGLAGLACADELNRNGIHATLYDASTRVGGCCASLVDFFPGQVAKRGGEFIDNLHKTMLAYAKRFTLALGLRSRASAPRMRFSRTSRAVSYPSREVARKPFLRRHG
jgi:monoamine oxidase